MLILPDEPKIIDPTGGLFLRDVHTERDWKRAWRDKPGGYWWCCCPPPSSSSAPMIACTCDTQTQMPQVTHVTFSNSGACTPFDGKTFTLTWAAGPKEWIFTDSVTFSPNTLSVAVFCANGACGNFQFLGGIGCGVSGFGLDFYKSCAAADFGVNAKANAGCSCSPLNMTFSCCLWGSNTPALGPKLCALYCNTGVNYTVTWTL